MTPYHFLLIWPNETGYLDRQVMTVRGERQADAFRILAGMINDSMATSEPLPSVLPFHSPEPRGGHPLELRP